MDATQIKTDLRIRLLAGDVVVAESQDPVLWQRVLATITTGLAPPPGSSTPPGTDPLIAEALTGDDPIGRFADDLRVSREELVGALSPEHEAPYLHLDSRLWEAFRKNFPAKGRNAVPKIVLASTALVLWCQHADVGQATQAQAQAILSAISDPDPNPSRGIRNCDWLQMRSGAMILNPAQASKARALVRAFCKKSGASSKGD